MKLKRMDFRLLTSLLLLVLFIVPLKSAIKLGRMDFPVWTSLLLLIFFIFPLKSESSDDSKEREKEDDNYDGTETGTSVTVDNNATNGMDGMTAMMLVQPIHDGMETAQIALKVGLPVALIGMVMLVGVIYIVFSGQLKDRVLGLGKSFAKIPDNSIPIYVANGLSSGKATKQMFSNPIYEVQIGLENIQYGNKPTSGYEYDNSEQGIYLCDKASQTGTNYHEYEKIDIKIPSRDHSTTCQTIDEGRAGTI